MKLEEYLGAHCTQKTVTVVVVVVKLLDFVCTLSKQSNLFEYYV